MVITKNVTLTQAWGILDLARTNTTNAVTSLPFFATAEFYTLGFAWEVSKIAPSTSPWTLFWNTIVVVRGRTVPLTQSPGSKAYSRRRIGTREAPWPRRWAS